MVQISAAWGPRRYDAGPAGARSNKWYCLAAVVRAVPDYVDRARVRFGPDPAVGTIIRSAPQINYPASLRQANEHQNIIPGWLFGLLLSFSFSSTIRRAASRQTNR